jgi:predicted Rossmann fold nucleotide-binding protein DprA/Smf involved in DNA uptake
MAKQQKPTFHVIVAGGRDFQNYEVMERMLDVVFAEKIKTHEVIIISGAANGADSLGEEYAIVRNMRCRVLPADWDKHGKSAGYKRNAQMAENADACVVFWDRASRGSKHMIDIAKSKGLLLRVFDYNGKLIEKK